MLQTCIIRYEHPFYIIMTPMSREFEVQRAEMRVELEMFMLNTIHKMEFYDRQKTINGLVIKLVQYNPEKVIFVVKIINIFRSVIEY